MFMLPKRIVASSLSIARVMLLLLIAGASTAMAQDLVDTSCRKNAVAVLPFVNRPQTIEAAVANLQITEIFGAQIPCATVVFEKDKELGKLMEVEANRGPRNYDNAVQAIREYLRTSAPEVKDKLAKRNPARSSLPVQILSGFVEEIFGFTSVTVVHVLESGTSEVYKFTFKTADLVSVGAIVSASIDQDEDSVLDIVNRRKGLIPIEIVPFDDSDAASTAAPSDLDSDKIRYEVRNFIVSRFSNPVATGFLQRKPFFRLAKEDDNNVRYRLTLRVESVGSRVFAVVRATEGVREKSLWIEDDITNLQKFEEKLLAGSQRALAKLEGLYDYSAAAGVSLLANQSSSARLFGIVLRQNLGSLAATARVRVGKSDVSEKSSESQTLILGGLGGAYQIVDIPMVALDLGLGVDGGIAQLQASSEAGAKAPEPNLYLSGNVFAQCVVSLQNGLSLIVRAGLEKPYEAPTGQSKTGGALPGQLDGFVGLGYSF
jgi:hypothetical protein